MKPRIGCINQNISEGGPLAVLRVSLLKKEDSGSRCVIQHDKIKILRPNRTNLNCTKNWVENLPPKSNMRMYIGNGLATQSCVWCSGSSKRSLSNGIEWPGHGLKPNDSTMAKSRRCSAIFRAHARSLKAETLLAKERMACKQLQ